MLSWKITSLLLNTCLENQKTLKANAETDIEKGLVGVVVITIAVLGCLVAKLCDSFQPHGLQPTRLLCP